LNARQGSSTLRVKGRWRAFEGVALRTLGSGRGDLLSSVRGASGMAVLRRLVDISKGMTLKAKLRDLKRFVENWLRDTPGQRQYRRLVGADYSHLKLSERTEHVVAQLRKELERIHAENALGSNYYSNALRREVVAAFEACVVEATKRFRQVNYLEIGSAQGCSMALVGWLLRAHGRLGRLVSVDPYFEQGYQEGARGVFGTCKLVQIDKKARSRAIELYEAIGLDVRVIEKTSFEALPELLRERAKFQLVYIDGSHERLAPLVDFGLSALLLRRRGIVLLDDHHWPDVKAVRKLCDLHCGLVHKCWKIAAYSVELQG